MEGEGDGMSDSKVHRPDFEEVRTKEERKRDREKESTGGGW